MRIALCDDNPEDLARLEALVNESLRAHALDAEIVRFSQSDALLRAAGRAPFDLYLLDILLDKLSGIQLVDEMREFQRDPRVIFFSTSRDYAYEAFQLDAVTYVAKPYTEQTFFAAMDRALGLMKDDPSKYLSLGTEGHVRRFKVNELEYVTTADSANYIRLHLADGTTVDTRSSIIAFAEANRELLTLTPLGRQLLVNPALASALDDTTLRFFSGHVLDVPRRSLRTLQNALLTC